MKPWYWKAAVGLVVYFTFIYVAQQTHDVMTTSGRHPHDVLFQDSAFFFVFPLVFILNAPPLYSKNSMYLLRLHKKASVFKYDAKKMIWYSLVYVSVVTLFVFVASLLVDASTSASVVIASFVFSMLSSLTMSGFIVVFSMYIGNRYSIMLAYSVAIILIIVRVAMFFDRFTVLDFIYIGMTPSLHHVGLYAAVYAANLGVIGLLYFLYDLRGKRDLI